MNGRWKYSLLSLSYCFLVLTLDNLRNMNVIVVDWCCLCKKKLTRVCSDHAPILLVGGNRHNGKCPFKFENMWLKDEGFMEKVRSWWGYLSFLGSPSFVLAKKLRALKGEIKRWSIEEFGNVEARNKA